MCMTRLKANSSKGFTIMEILVAFMISLIGLQGLIAIQSLSLGNAQGSYYRAQAITLLNDIAGRMNANPEAVVNGDYDGFNTSTAPQLPGCIGTEAGCTTAELALRDLNNWSTNFVNANSVDDYASLLPNGSGSIALQDDGSYLITVSWNESQWNTELDEGNDQQNVVASVTRNVNVLVPF